MEMSDSEKENVLRGIIEIVGEIFHYALESIVSDGFWLMFNYKKAPNRGYFSKLMTSNETLRHEEFIRREAFCMIFAHYLKQTKVPELYMDCFSNTFINEKGLLAFLGLRTLTVSEAGSYFSMVVTEYIGTEEMGKKTLRRYKDVFGYWPSDELTEQFAILDYGLKRLPVIEVV